MVKIATRKNKSICKRIHNVDSKIRKKPPTQDSSFNLSTVLNSNRAL